MPNESPALFKLEGLVHDNVRLEIFNVGLLRYELDFSLKRFVQPFLVLFLGESLNHKVTLDPLPFTVNNILHLFVS